MRCRTRSKCQDRFLSVFGVIFKNVSNYVSKLSAKSIKEGNEYLKSAFSLKKMQCYLTHFVAQSLSYLISVFCLICNFVTAVCVHPFTTKSKISEKLDQNWGCSSSALLGWRAIKFCQLAVFSCLNLFLALSNLSFGSNFLKFWI